MRSLVERWKVLSIFLLAFVLAIVGFVVTAKSTQDEALFLAASRGDLDGIRRALKNGANINAREEEAETPLIYAAASGKDGAISLLVAEGANVDAVSRNNESALARAVLYGHLETVKLLLKRGADPNVGYGTALFHAARSGNLEMIRLLLGGGANVNIKNHCGATALIEALFHRRGFETIATLLEAGSDANAKGCDGKSALRIANENTTIEIVEKLKQAGARE